MWLGEPGKSRGPFRHSLFFQITEDISKYCFAMELFLTWCNKRCYRKQGRRSDGMGCQIARIVLHLCTNGIFCILIRLSLKEEKRPTYVRRPVLLEIRQSHSPTWSCLLQISSPNSRSPLVPNETGN